jgi:D-serine deaminase-like pyridoxal phosphate-dependent protein
VSGSVGIASWPEINNPQDVPSPALLIYFERVEENIRRMIRMAGGVDRLRPHIKTHKLAELVRLQLAEGISRFKCATIAELELAASCGAPDVLLAYPIIGPNVERLLQIIRTFGQTRVSVLADEAVALRTLAAAAERAGVTVDVLLDLDCGMGRTGISPGPAAAELYRLMSSLPGVRALGLHAYDGHIHDSDPELRAKHCREALAPVRAFKSHLELAGLAVPRMVVGGTPTFPFHALDPEVECSPGTCIFWDAGYSANLPDLDFLPAALVLTRVISKPGGNRICLDLGHKAIASENPHPRVHFPAWPAARPVMHSEEHLVVETPRAGEVSVGDCWYGIPWHICPTVALHGDAYVARAGHVTERWRVTGRDRRLTI